MTCKVDWALRYYDGCRNGHSHVYMERATDTWSVHSVDVDSHAQLYIHQSPAVYYNNNNE